MLFLYFVWYSFVLQSLLGIARYQVICDVIAGAWGKKF